MNKTSIEWVRNYQPDGSFTQGHTVNPIRFRPRGSDRSVTMCQKVSPGCTRCYAASIVRRFWPKNAGPFPGYTAAGLLSGDFIMAEKQILSVLRFRNPTKVFWGDMTDLFGHWVTRDWLDRCFAVCALTPHIQHIFLTKRADRMANHWLGRSEKDRTADLQGHITDLCLSYGIKQPEELKNGWGGLPLRNTILGCSVEAQPYSDERQPYMEALSCDGWRTMVSYEPALGLVDWSDWSFLSWLVSGGESGPGARESKAHWHRAARDFCLQNGIAYHFKQWGAWVPTEDPKVAEARGIPLGICMSHVGKKAAGALLDGVEYRQFPEVRQ